MQSNSSGEASGEVTEELRRRAKCNPKYPCLLGEGGCGSTLGLSGELPPGLGCKTAHLCGGTCVGTHPWPRPLLRSPHCVHVSACKHPFWGRAPRANQPRGERRGSQRSRPGRGCHPRWHFGVEMRCIATSCLCFPGEAAPRIPYPSQRLKANPSAAQEEPSRGPPPPIAVRTAVP